MSELWARASVRAKVNLWLAVRSRTSDGYHEIETVFQCIDVADEIVVSGSSVGDVRVEMKFADGEGVAPAPHDNLVYRAAQLYLAATDRSIGLNIEIVKRIPMSAGLGGGSADAAGVLFLLAQALGDVSGSMLHKLAADVGSDVPFFLTSGTALGAGRGERLIPVEGAPRLWFVLGLSRRGMATKEVYERWDLTPNSARSGSDAMLEALARGRPELAASLVHNDLEPAAIAVRPELAEKKRRMLEAGALGACVSGSGPTLFGIARNRRHAREVAGRLHDAFDRVLVTESAWPCIERY